MLPIYQIISTDPASHALLYDADTERVRVWDFGYALEYEVFSGPNVKPYVVWQILPSEYDNTLSCPPAFERLMIQFDVYARDPFQATNIHNVIQSPLMPYGQMVMNNGQEFDSETKLYRSGFDFSYLNLRS